MIKPRRKLLMMSDSPSTSTGLSRVWREVTQRIHDNLADEFEVASLGLGGNYSSRFPWPQYTIMRIDQMVVHDLPAVCREFFGDERALGYQRGTLAVCWNASWLRWLAEPASLPPSPLRDYLTSGRDGSRPFDLWLYCPIDGHTPTGRLPADSIAAIKGMDRVLAYTQYGASIIDRCLAAPAHDALSPSLTLAQMAQPALPPTSHLPHGLDRSTFYPRDRTLARQHFLARIQGKTGPADLAAALPIRDTMVLLGCIATNSLRKDWGLTFETCGELLKRGVNVFLWCHVDAPVKHWALPALALETGMANRTVITCDPLSEDNLAWSYSALDCVLGNASGEGWGFVEAESLAMQVPVIHGRYAGAAEFVPDSCLVEPVGYRVDGTSMILRPVFKAADWANAVEANLHKPVSLPDYIDWDNCWPRWAAWLLSGVAE